MRIAAALFLVLTACATTSKPCQDAGDVTWEWGPKYTAPKGNKQCLQTKDPKTGAWRNDGRYVVWFPNGEVALEGNFKEGLKSGKWTQFDEAGKKVVEREFEQGKEIKPGEGVKDGTPR